MSEPDPFADAMLAAELLVRDLKLGGIVLRGDGPARDEVLAFLKAKLSARRLPPNIDDEALEGGRDLAALLGGRTAGHRQGLLAEADGGLIVVPMAERLDAGIAARIAAAKDGGETRFGLVLLDDGGDDESVSGALAERCAFSFDLTHVHNPGLDPGQGNSFQPLAEGSLGPDQVRADEALATIAHTCLALGIDSMRAPLFVVRVARQLGDVATAARLVLAHRATRMPVEDMPDDAPVDEQAAGAGERLEDKVVAATAAAIPKDVLARIAEGRTRRASGAGAGVKRRTPTRGRALGSRAGLPRGGKRLAIVDTLRAAAPWQKLRGRDGAVVIRKGDLRIRRFEMKSAATTIFAVDASGSAAAARLGEAKGAVELLLGEAYAKRTEVALVAFRGTSAEVLLPPTRSLTRARRELGDLPGGGTTPLAAGIDAARLLADGVRARHRTPFVVMLSDGRGNVGDDPLAASERAGRVFAATGTGAVFIDISTRPRAEAARVAAAMGARYLPLPNADAARLSAAVRDAAP